MYLTFKFFKCLVPRTAIKDDQVQCPPFASLVQSTEIFHSVLQLLAPASDKMYVLGLYTAKLPLKPLRCQWLDLISVSIYSRHAHIGDMRRHASVSIPLVLTYVVLERILNTLLR